MLRSDSRTSENIPSLPEKVGKNYQRRSHVTCTCLLSNAHLSLDELFVSSLQIMPMNASETRALERRFFINFVVGAME
jgi:hypothetical protein